MSVMRRVGALAVGVWVSACALGAGTLGDLAFMTGSWKGAMFGGTAEEHWTGASGGSMAGMFRLVREGKTAVTELTLIEEEEGGEVMLRFKHIGPGWIAWEKEEALTFRLREAGGERAVFEAVGAEQGIRRIEYARGEGETLTIKIVSEREGQERAVDVVMARGALGN
ncbi:MAG: DUF6265 family protein [Phycisphaerales bacterium]